MVNLELERQLVQHRIAELRRAAARMRQVRVARTPRAPERDQSRIVQLRHTPDVRPERTPSA